MGRISKPAERILPQRLRIEAVEVANQAVVPEYPDLVRRKVHSLPEHQRVAMVLYYYQGQTQSEIADVLSISQQAAQSRIKNGLESLKKDMSGSGAAATSITAVESAMTSAVALDVPIGLS